MKTILTLLSLITLAMTAQGAGGIAPPRAYDIFDRALTRKHGTNMTLWGATNHFTGISPTNTLTLISAPVGENEPAIAINGVQVLTSREDATTRALYIGQVGAGLISGIRIATAGIDDGASDPRIILSHLTGGAEMTGVRVEQNAIDDMEIVTFTDFTSLGGGAYMFRSDSSGNSIFGDAFWPTILRGSPTVASRSNFLASAALATAATSVSLTADNQVIATEHKSWIRLSSDNATAANRTFVLKGGAAQVAGQRLILEWTGTNAGELVDDAAQNTSGNHRLASTWTPTQYDTITLVFNGTDWVETNRSTN